MVGMGYSREEITDSLARMKYDDITATYLLLGRRANEVSLRGDTGLAGNGRCITVVTGVFDVRAGGGQRLVVLQRRLPAEAPPTRRRRSGTETWPRLRLRPRQAAQGQRPRYGPILTVV